MVRVFFVFLRLFFFSVAQETRETSRVFYARSAGMRAFVGLRVLHKFRQLLFCSDMEFTVSQ